MSHYVRLISTQWILFEFAECKAFEMSEYILYNIGNNFGVL